MHLWLLVSYLYLVTSPCVGFLQVYMSSSITVVETVLKHFTLASVLQPSAKNNVASAFGRECFSEPILIICKASYTFYKQILRNRPVAHIGNTWCWMFIFYQNLVKLNLKPNFFYSHV